MFFMFVDVNECLLSPCNNGGTSNNMEGDYTCTCTGAWKGSHCDEGM